MGSLPLRPAATPHPPVRQQAVLLPPASRMLHWAVSAGLPATAEALLRVLECQAGPGGLTGALAGHEPGGTNADDVHQAIPMNLQRPDADGHRVYIRIGQHS